MTVQPDLWSRFEPVDLSDRELALQRQVREFCDRELPHGSRVPGLGMNAVADPEFSRRLAARGWVRRERSDVDQRGFYAQLTEDGALVLAAIAPGHVAAVRENLIGLLTEQELAALAAIGEKVRLHLAEPTGERG